jgi:predicted RNA binding protein YcfA (HicA-like mRNA interferase family)
MKRVAGKDLGRILERAGWTLVRTRGSHRTYEKPGFGPITVPFHANKTMPLGTQRDIMKKAGLSDSDL